MSNRIDMGAREWVRRLPSGQSAEPSDRIDAQAQALAQELGLSPLTVQVCLNRGLSSADDIRQYLNPRLETITDPARIRDMDRGVERLVRAREAGEPVLIFGDYDVDGTTGAALFSWIFREMGFVFDARQPDRFKDGYGLNVGAVEQAKEEGVRVLVTVDCGITSFDAVTRANELGIDVIIVDHHQIDPLRGNPLAYAVIDPQRADCESGLKQLCGCGLAFYVSTALRKAGRARGWFEGKKEPNLKQHLDLVVIATAADLVPLTGDNRILVSHGMEVLKRSTKPGVAALMSVSGLSAKEFTPGQLGFVLGPRINASGRMQSASLALEMLTTMEPERATELALELERLNRERQETQDQIWTEVRAQVEAGIARGEFEAGIVVASEGWHEGVVGIVASRVVEMFRRPAVVISIHGDRAKGSVRTYASKDVLQALRSCADLLVGFGGHKHAAGLSLKTESLAEFTEAFDAACAALPDDETQKPVLVDGACTMDQLTVGVLTEMERLGPHGPGNPEPVFVVRGRGADPKVLKGKHLKLRLTASGLERVDAIWFFAAERFDFPDVPEVLDANGEAAEREPLSALLDSDSEWAAVPELNRFRGRVTPTLRVRDWRKPSVN